MTQQNVTEAIARLTALSPETRSAALNGHLGFVVQHAEWTLDMILKCMADDGISSLTREDVCEYHINNLRDFIREAGEVYNTVSGATPVRPIPPTT